MKTLRLVLIATASLVAASAHAGPGVQYFARRAPATPARVSAPASPETTASCTHMVVRQGKFMHLVRCDTMRGMAQCEAHCSR